MTHLQAATMALYAAALIAAVALARRDSSCRPVAWYLGAVVVLDCCRWGRALLMGHLVSKLPGAHMPREGLALVLRSAEVGLYLASILALPALAVVVFGHHGEKARRRSHDEVVRLRALAQRSAGNLATLSRPGKAGDDGYCRRPRADCGAAKAARGQRRRRPGPDRKSVV